MELKNGAGMLLHVTTVSVRGRWWWRWRWRQLLVVPLLRGGSVGQHEGVVGLSAGTERGQATQVAGRPRQPHLGSLRGSDHAAVKLGLHEPRGDLDRGHGVHVWHEGRVLNPSWMKGRNRVSTSRV